ncbi:MAG TPA: hypothetical protein VGF61_22255 [Candidatus Acidoferrum sp.]|jgi:hypothetical protein
MNFRKLRHARISFERPGILLWAVVLTVLFLPLASPSCGQTSTTPAQAPGVQEAAPAQQKDVAAKPNSTAKPKKVITNEDLEPRSVPGATDKIITGSASSLLNCDAACEQQARELLGYDANYEAEWRMQVVRARRDLIADSEWRGMLSQSIDQMRTYCNFLAQESQKTAPSGNSWDAQVQRARNAKYFESMGNTLRQGLQANVTRMNNRIKEAGELSPARGAMMNVQANRIFDRSCDQPAQR